MRKRAAMIGLGLLAALPVGAQRASDRWSVRMFDSVMRRDTIVHPEWDYVPA